MPKDNEFTRTINFNFPPAIGVFMWWEATIYDALLGGKYKTVQIDANTWLYKYGMIESTSEFMGYNSIPDGFQARVTSQIRFLKLLTFTSKQYWAIKWLRNPNTVSAELTLIYDMPRFINWFCKKAIHKSLINLWNEFAKIGEWIYDDRDKILEHVYLSNPEHKDKVSVLLDEVKAIDRASKIPERDAQEAFFHRINYLVERRIANDINLEERKKKIRELLNDLRIWDMVSGISDEAYKEEIRENLAQIKTDKLVADVVSQSEADLVSGPKVHITLSTDEQRSQASIFISDGEAESVSGETEIPELAASKDWVREEFSANPRGGGTDLSTAAGPNYAFASDAEKHGTIFYKALPENVRQSFEAIPNRRGSRLEIDVSHADPVIPWELMYDGRVFLCRDMAMVRVTNRSGPSRQPGGVSKLLVVGADPKNDIPNVWTEIKLLEDVVALSGSAFSCEVLLGSDATRANVVNRIRSGEFDALHFAGHSDYDKDRPGQSHLLLSGDDRLTVTDLMTLLRDKPMEMVFLNSCSSAALGEDSGDLAGVAKAFSERGVPYVIGMVRKVEDQGAMELAAGFYYNLVNGVDPVESMRRARINVVSQIHGAEPTWAAPVIFAN